MYKKYYHLGWLGKEVNPPTVDNSSPYKVKSVVRAKWPIRPELIPVLNWASELLLSEVTIFTPQVTNTILISGSKIKDKKKTNTGIYSHAEKEKLTGTRSGKPLLQISSFKLKHKCQIKETHFTPQKWILKKSRSSKPNSWSLNFKLLFCSRARLSVACFWATIPFNFEQLLWHHKTCNSNESDQSNCFRER